MRPVALVVAGSSLLVTACAADFTPFAVELIRDDELTIIGSCADDLSGEVVETESEVRVGNFEGRFSDDDCAATVTIQLDRPLGDRKLVVNGTTWVELSPTCPYGTLGNPNMEFSDDRCDPVGNP